jgi:hypothetical protein
MTNQMYILLAIVLLLIFSAIPTTATAAMWVGFFLLALVWLNAYKNKELYYFGQELLNQRGMVQ